MKRIMTTLVLALALGSAAIQASAQNRTTFPDGYQELTPEDLAPRANAIPHEVLMQSFPKGSRYDGPGLTAAARAASPGDPELLALFPRPSFNTSPDRNDYATNLAATQYKEKHAAIEKARLAAKENARQAASAPINAASN